jgi:hypothetical protein
MSTPFPPSRESILVPWSTNFGTKIGNAPESVGLTPLQAAAYSALHDSFVSLYNTVNDPATRSPMNIALKDVAKQALLDEIRLLAGIIQSFPGTTNPMRVDLNLPTRGNEPTPIPAPAKAPLVVVKSVEGRTVRCRLIDVDNPIKRGKPEGVSGAALFSYVGETAPAELADWKFEGNTGRTTVEVLFPSTLAAGTTVWLTAFWFNPRKQAGPLSDAIRAYLPGGSVSMAA